MRRKEAARIEEAIRKPFTDWKKLAVGTVFALIPVLNFISVGYGLKNLKTPKKMPEFDYVNDFILGAKFFILALVYALVPIVIGAILWYADYEVAAAISILIIALLLILPYVRAAIELGKTGALSSALEIKRMARESYTAKFFRLTIGMLIIAVLFGVVSAVFSRIPVVGWIVSAFLEFAASIAVWSYAGSA